MQLRKDNQDAFVKRHGIKLGFMSAFVKASAYALTQQPTVNAVIEGNEIVYRDYVDISIAVATPKVSWKTQWIRWLVDFDNTRRAGQTWQPDVSPLHAAR